MKSHVLAAACFLTLAACTDDPAPDRNPSLTARFSTATHDQLGITLYTAADLIDVELYSYMVVMSSAANPGCEPLVRPGDVTFIGCGGSSGGEARAENSSLTWPRDGSRAGAAGSEILSATRLDLGDTRTDGWVVRSSPAGAVELGAEVAIDVTMQYQHPWAGSTSALQITELPDGPGVHYVVLDTSRILVDGVGRAAVSADLRLTEITSTGVVLDGWLELRGDETLRATFDPAEECTALAIDGVTVAPLCDW